MKRYAAFILAIALFASIALCVRADNPAPYTSQNDDGTYNNLPEAGNHANGQIIFDNEYAKVTVLRCSYPEEVPQYHIDLLIENRAGCNMFVTAGDNVIVDGFAFDAYCQVIVSPGTLSEAGLDIMAEDFYKADIITPQEIKFNLTFMDNDTGDYIDTAYFAIYPSGLTADEVVYKSIEDIGYSELNYYNELLDCGFRVTDARLIDAGDFYAIDIIVENASNDHKVFSLKNVKVNGVETDPHWLEGLPGSSRRISYIYLDMYELAQNGVEEVDTVEFVFTIDDPWRTLLSQWVEYTPAKG